MYKYKDKYMYIEFPYISKSSYNMYKTCKYKFKRYTIDKIENESNEYMARGTGLHYIYYKFFDLVDLDILWDLDYVKNHDTEFNQVFVYFYSLCATLIPEKANDSYFISNIKCFCRLEENHWFHLRTHYRTKKEINKQFMTYPMAREYFLRNDEHQIFGTVDRKVYEDDGYILLDYKSSDAKNVKNDSLTEKYSKNLSSYYVREGNFYVLLDLLNSGYNAEIIDGRWEIVKDGKVCSKIVSKHEFAFAFTGSGGRWPIPYVARKKASIRSIRAILDNIYAIRERTEWPREPDMYKCRFCGLFLTECKGKIPYEIYKNLH